MRWHRHTWPRANRFSRNKSQDQRTIQHRQNSLKRWFHTREVNLQSNYDTLVDTFCDIKQKSLHVKEIELPKNNLENNVVTKSWGLMFYYILKKSFTHHQKPPCTHRFVCNANGIYHHHVLASKIPTQTNTMSNSLFLLSSEKLPLH